MLMTKEAETILQNYLHAVERKLPLRKRNDIIRELHSTIMDTLEAEFGDEEIHEDQMSSFLQEFGSPSAIAAGYHEIRPLIPSALLPLFSLIVTIVGAVLTGIFIVGIIVDAVSGSLTGVSFFLELAELFTGVTSAFGIIVLVFIILDHTLKPEDIPFSSLDDAEDWDPKKLPKAEFQRRPKTAESVISIVFGLVLIIAFNLFAEDMAMQWSSGSTCVYIPALGPGFLALIPLLTFRWSLGILVHAGVLLRPAKLLWFRISEVLLSCFDFAIILMMLRSDADSIIRFDLLANTEIGDAVPILRWLYYGILILILLLSLFEAVKGSWNLLKRSHDLKSFR